MADFNYHDLFLTFEMWSSRTLELTSGWSGRCSKESNSDVTLRCLWIRLLLTLRHVTLFMPWIRLLLTLHHVTLFIPWIRLLLTLHHIMLLIPWIRLLLTLHHVTLFIPWIRLLLTLHHIMLLIPWIRLLLTLHHVTLSMPWIRLLLMLRHVMLFMDPSPPDVASRYVVLKSWIRLPLLTWYDDTIHRFTAQRTDRSSITNQYQINTSSITLSLRTHIRISLKLFQI